MKYFWCYPHHVCISTRDFFPSTGMTRGKGSGELFIQCMHQWKRYCNLQLLIVELPLKGLGVFEKYAAMKIWP